MKIRYKQAVLKELHRTKENNPGILKDSDIQHLPEIVKKYLRLTNSMGKEKVLNFRAEFSGGIRFKPGEEYMPLRSVQYNFIDIPSRLFYIIAKKKGIPAVGLHLYREGKAIFKIKILGLFTVVNAKGPKMDQGETVTVFNDMCFMAPATLIDKRITWEDTGSLTVKAKFTVEGITISADLFFNEKGELVNFISNDRFETDGREYKNYPWATPVMAYTEMNGFRLPGRAKLIYSRPDGDFCYGEFELVNLEYNCRKFR